jgi:uncharacterized membrane protein
LKIKILNWLIIIDILSILLVFSIILIPSSIARIVLGLPFLLFFPGYALTEALFAKKEGIGGIERGVLSFGMSIAITALIGFGLNYTTTGIKLETVLYSIFCFIIVMSAIAMIRQKKLTTGFNLRLPGWEGSKLNKTLSILLIIFIIGTFGILGYTLAVPKIGEIFTEFYILGHDGKAQDYPSELIMKNDQVIQVTYGAGAYITTGGWAEVTLGIVNHEQKKVTYSVKITIDGEPVSTNNGGTIVDQLGPIELKQGEKWEQEIGFAPRHVGYNQKVEFVLFKDNNIYPDSSLSLWINVEEAEQS